MPPSGSRERNRTAHSSEETRPGRCGAYDPFRYADRSSRRDGPDGKRRQVKRGGFASAKEAADARGSVIASHPARALLTDRTKTVAERWPASPL